MSAIQQSLLKYVPSIAGLKTKKKEEVRTSSAVVQEEGNIISLIDLELRKVSIPGACVYLKFIAE